MHILSSAVSGSRFGRRPTGKFRLVVLALAAALVAGACQPQPGETIVSATPHGERIEIGLDSDFTDPAVRAALTPELLAELIATYGVGQVTDDERAQALAERPELSVLSRTGGRVVRATTTDAALTTEELLGIFRRRLDALGEGGELSWVTPVLPDEVVAAGVVDPAPDLGESEAVAATAAPVIVDQDVEFVEDVGEPEPVAAESEPEIVEPEPEPEFVEPEPEPEFVEPEPEFVPEPEPEPEFVEPEPETFAAQGYFGTVGPGGYLPSGEECAGAVGSSPELRPANEGANYTVVDAGSVAINGDKRGSGSQAYRIDGNYTGSTTDIIRWGACKWGIDEDTVKAIAMAESSWNQSQLGDYSNDGDACGQIYQGAGCYLSYGLVQVKGSVHVGTYPYVEQSTAFAVDYGLGWIRACYEGGFTWLGGGAGDLWGCIGAWYSGQWYSGGSVQYQDTIQSELSQRRWDYGDF